jgi:preprotein translocase subunit SecG
MQKLALLIESILMVVLVGLVVWQRYQRTGGAGDAFGDEGYEHCGHQ